MARFAPLSAIRVCPRCGCAHLDYSHNECKGACLGGQRTRTILFASLVHTRDPGALLSHTWLPNVERPARARLPIREWRRDDEEDAEESPDTPSNVTRLPVVTALQSLLASTYQLTRVSRVSVIQCNVCRIDNEENISAPRRRFTSSLMKPRTRMMINMAVKMSACWNFIELQRLRSASYTEKKNYCFFSTV